jgi:hypothetical protein
MWRWWRSFWRTRAAQNFGDDALEFGNRWRSLKLPRIGHLAFPHHAQSQGDQTEDAPPIAEVVPHYFETKLAFVDPAVFFY